MFERARYLSVPDSQVSLQSIINRIDSSIDFVNLSKVYQDAVALQRFYIDLRDQKCCYGNLLQSPALLYNGIRLQEELIRNQGFPRQISHSDMNNEELILRSNNLVRYRFKST